MFENEEDVPKITKKLATICPVCKDRVEFQCDTDLVEHAAFYPVACSFKHCQKTIIVYIDANYKVRGTETAYDLSDNVEFRGLKSDSISIAAFVQPSIERRTIYSCLAGCESMMNESIPNIIEKQLLRHIHEKQKVSLAILADSVKGLEKAMNITIDYAFVKRLLQKYVTKGIISERIIEAG